MRVSVDIDVDDVLAGMDSDEIAQLARDEGFEVLAVGAGDRSVRENTIERAFLAAKQIANLPREIADIFWHVHGRAI